MEREEAFSKELLTKFDDLLRKKRETRAEKDSNLLVLCLKGWRYQCYVEIQGPGSRLFLKGRQ